MSAPDPLAPYRLADGTIDVDALELGRPSGPGGLGMTRDEYRALDGTGDLAGPPGPSPATLEAEAAASLQRSRARRQERDELAGFIWAAAGGLMLAGSIVVGIILAGH